MTEPGQDRSPGEVLDTKMIEQERFARELEARVRQLELIAIAHGQVPHQDLPEQERPDAPQAS